MSNFFTLASDNIHTSALRCCAFKMLLMGPAGAFCPSMRRAIFAGVCRYAFEPDFVVVEADKAFVVVEDAKDTAPFLD